MWDKRAFAKAIKPFYLVSANLWSILLWLIPDQSTLQVKHCTRWVIKKVYLKELLKRVTFTKKSYLKVHLIKKFKSIPLSVFFTNHTLITTIRAIFPRRILARISILLWFKVPREPFENTRNRCQTPIGLHTQTKPNPIQWGKKVFSQPPIVQVLPLEKMREACNFHHRYTSTMRDKIRKKNI